MLWLLCLLIHDLIKRVTWSEIEFNAVTRQLTWAPWKDELAGLAVRVHLLNIWVYLFCLKCHRLDLQASLLRIAGAPTAAAEDKSAHVAQICSECLSEWTDPQLIYRFNFTLLCMLCIEQLIPAENTGPLSIKICSTVYRPPPVSGALDMFAAEPSITFFFLHSGCQVSSIGQMRYVV